MFNEQFLQTESIIFTLYREYWNCLRNLVSLRNAWIFSRVCRRILDNNIIYNITHIIGLNFLVGRVGHITRNAQFHKRELGKLVDQLRVASGKLCRCTANLRCKSYASRGEHLPKFISSEGNSFRKCAACWKNEILRSSVSYPVSKNSTLKRPTESLTSFVHFSRLWIL